jgi:Flp pilus assembly protein TadG
VQVKRFKKDRKGSISVGFAIMGFTLVAGSGIGLDLSLVVAEKARLQAAADGAALSANYQSDGLTATAIKVAAENYFDATYMKPAKVSVERSVTVLDGEVTVNATAKMPTVFAPFLGFDEFIFSVMAQTEIGKASFDIALVLDNSGSMAGTKIDTLKTAASDLIETLLDINDISDRDDRVKIGLVPFTAFVNVGGDKRGAAWLDMEGQSPVHWNNFEVGDDGKPDPAAFDSAYLVNGNPSRFTLYDQLENTSWRGCVEARPMPYDVTDDPADSSIPATLYVPGFAPDEPDSYPDNRNGHRYSNDWTDDDDGACSWSSGTAADNNVYDQGDSVSRDPLELQEVAQGRLCKYRNQPVYYGTGYSRGPNYLCKTQEITDLTTSRTDLLAAVDSMRADGYTNIHQGVVWGWRLLTPQAPFVQGRSPDPAADEEHRRILIIMTDGANTYQNKYYSHNRTEYNAYGYGTEERLGDGIDSANEIAYAMDDRTELACENAKAYEAMQVYTIAFQVSDTTTKNMLRDCATSPSMAYESNSNSELVTAFAQISKEISKLRLNR